MADFVIGGAGGSYHFKIERSHPHSFTRNVRVAVSYSDCHLAGAGFDFP